MIRNTVVKIIFFSLLCTSIPSLFGMNMPSTQFSSFNDGIKVTRVLSSAQGAFVVIPKDVSREIIANASKEWVENNKEYILDRKDFIKEEILTTNLDLRDVLFRSKDQLDGLRALDTVRYHYICSAQANADTNPVLTEEAFNQAIAEHLPTREKFLTGNGKFSEYDFDNFYVLVPKKPKLSHGSVVQAGFYGGLCGASLYLVLSPRIVKEQQWQDGNFKPFIAATVIGAAAGAGKQLISNTMKDYKQVPTVPQHPLDAYEKRSLFPEYQLRKFEINEKKWQQLMLPKE